MLLPAASLLFSIVAIIFGTCRALLLSPTLHHVDRRQTILKTLTSSPRMPPLCSTISKPSISVQDISVKDILSITAPPNNETTAIQNEQLAKELGSAFAQKLLDLEAYQLENGHCLVPKRYESNPSLGNWVNKQRQSYRKYLNGEKSSINEVCECCVGTMYCLQMI